MNRNVNINSPKEVSEVADPEMGEGQAKQVTRTRKKEKEYKIHFQYPEDTSFI